MFKKIILLVAIIVFPLAFNAYGAGDHDDFYEMKTNGGKFWSILESLPYASEGKGPIMYTFEFSECPYCQKMYNDFGNKDVGIEFRRMFVPVSDRSGLETAALGKSRNISDYHAFMKGTKQAPQFNTDNAAIDPFNAIIKGTQDLTVILKQNQWPLKGFSYPQYAWMENGKVFTNAGYSKESFSKAIARAKAGYVEQEKTATTMKNVVTSVEPAPSKPKTSGGIDIVGVQIGMTQDEAVQALKDFDPRIKFQFETVKIVAPDSNKQLHDMGSYQNAIQAWLRHGIEGFNLMEEPTEKIVIYFSPPPTEQCVEFVGRELTYPTGKGPDFNLTMQSIAKKYGTPMSKKDNNGRLPVQFWQERGPSLDGKQFIRYTNKSGILAPLNYKGGPYHAVGGARPLISEDSIGQSLGIMVNKGGHLVQMMRFMLADDKKTVEENHAATWDMGQAILQKHEQKIKGAAQQRGGPRL